MDRRNNNNGSQRRRGGQFDGKNEIRFSCGCFSVKSINPYFGQRSFRREEQVHSIGWDTKDGGESHQPPHDRRPPGIVVLAFEVDDRGD